MIKPKIQKAETKNLPKDIQQLFNFALKQLGKNYPLYQILQQEIRVLKDIKDMQDIIKKHIPFKDVIRQLILENPHIIIKSIGQKKSQFCNFATLLKYLNTIANFILQPQQMVGATWTTNSTVVRQKTQQINQVIVNNVQIEDESDDLEQREVEQNQDLMAQINKVQKPNICVVSTRQGTNSQKINDPMLLDQMIEISEENLFVNTACSFESFSIDCFFSF